MASKLRDETGFAHYDTPMRKAVAVTITENNPDEEMRVLYVALTRARERLIVTASCSKPQELIDSCAASARYVSPYLFSENPSYIKWILTALKTAPYDGCCEIKTIDSVHMIPEHESADVKTGSAEKCDEAQADEYRKVIKERSRIPLSGHISIKNSRKAVRIRPLSDDT